jgi:hypothetical protein
MKLVKKRYIPGWYPPCAQKRDWIKIQQEEEDGIRCAVVYVTQLGCEGELGLLSAIQVYA